MVPKLIKTLFVLFLTVYIVNGKYIDPSPITENHTDNENNTSITDIGEKTIQTLLEKMNKKKIEPVVVKEDTLYLSLDNFEDSALNIETSADSSNDNRKILATDEKYISVEKRQSPDRLARGRFFNRRKNKAAKRARLNQASLAFLQGYAGGDYGYSSGFGGYGKRKRDVSQEEKKPLHILKSNHHLYNRTRNAGGHPHRLKGIRNFKNRKPENNEAVVPLQRKARDAPYEFYKSLEEPRTLSFYQQPEQPYVQQPPIVYQPPTYVNFYQQMPTQQVYNTYATPQQPGYDNFYAQPAQNFDAFNQQPESFARDVNADQYLEPNGYPNPVDTRFITVPTTSATEQNYDNTIVTPDFQQQNVEQYYYIQQPIYGQPQQQSDFGNVYPQPVYQTLSEPQEYNYPYPQDNINEQQQQFEPVPTWKKPNFSPYGIRLPQDSYEEFEDSDETDESIQKSTQLEDNEDEEDSEMEFESNEENNYAPQPQKSETPSINGYAQNIPVLPSAPLNNIQKQAQPTNQYAVSQKLTQPQDLNELPNTYDNKELQGSNLPDDNQNQYASLVPQAQAQKADLSTLTFFYGQPQKTSNPISTYNNQPQPQPQPTFTFLQPPASQPTYSGSLNIQKAQSVDTTYNNQPQPQPTIKFLQPPPSQPTYGGSSSIQSVQAVDTTYNNQPQPQPTITFLQPPSQPTYGGSSSIQSVQAVDTTYNNQPQPQPQPTITFLQPPSQPTYGGSSSIQSVQAVDTTYNNQPQPQPQPTITFLQPPSQPTYGGSASIQTVEAVDTTYNNQPPAQPTITFLQPPASQPTYTGSSNIQKSQSVDATYNNVQPNRIFKLLQPPTAEPTYAQPVQPVKTQKVSVLPKPVNIPTYVPSPSSSEQPQKTVIIQRKKLPISKNVVRPVAKPDYSYNQQPVLPNIRKSEVIDLSNYQTDKYNALEKAVADAYDTTNIQSSQASNVDNQYNQQSVEQPIAPYGSQGSSNYGNQVSLTRDSFSQTNTQSTGYIQKSENFNTRPKSFSEKYGQWNSGNLLFGARDQVIPSSVCPSRTAEPIYEGDQVTETYCRCNNGSYGFTCLEGFFNPCSVQGVQFAKADPSLPPKYFIHCNWGIANLKKCSAELIWNQNKETCVWPNQPTGNEIIGQGSSQSQSYANLPY